MPPCPRCGESLVISQPHGPSTWVERCPGCGHEGGGTVYIPLTDIADDNGPEFTIYVVDPGPNRSRLFHLYRETLGLSPAEANRGHYFRLDPIPAPVPEPTSLCVFAALAGVILAARRRRLAG